MADIKLKSQQEILKRLRDLIHRHKKRYLKKYLAPSVNNCRGSLAYLRPDLAEHLDYNEDRCTFCKCKDPGSCNDPELFKPRYTKDEIIEKFKEDIKDPQKLPRDFRDVAILMWVLGLFDTDNDDDKN